MDTRSRRATLARDMPVVRGGVLSLIAGEGAGKDEAGTRSIPLETPAWWDWLTQDSADHFLFTDGSVTFTARRRRSRGQWRWRAIVRSGGANHELALGESDDLMLARLQAASASLAGQLELDAGEHGRAEPTPQPPPPPLRAPLLTTKLFAPLPPPGLVARPRLLEALEAGLHGSLTLLVAPAGSGKTTALSSWFDRAQKKWADSRRMSWVALDAGDNDPARFWTYILTALDRAQHGVAADALALLQAPLPPPIETVLTALLNALGDLQQDVVLLLDDFHRIEAPQTHAAVAFLLDHLPQRLHVVLATREDPPLGLARRRASGTLIEVRADDLRFTTGEAADLLTTALDLALPAESIAALETRSEGWVTGLQLAALSMQGRSPQQIQAFIAAFTGSNRYIVDYLVEEVLSRQPATMQNFLLRVAVLDHFCAPLCERLFPADDATEPECNGAQSPRRGAVSQGRPGSSVAQALLEQAERANLFLIPLDDERRWYRYHHLFADVLRSQLRQRDPDLYSELLRRASVWYEEEGLVEEAVEHALAASDFARAAELIEQYGLGLGEAGRVETVLAWLRGLPEALIVTRPVLCACHAMILFLSDGMGAAMEARVRDAEKAFAALREAGAAEEWLLPTSGMLALVRALVAVGYGDMRTSVTLAQEALERLPQTDTIWRTVAKPLLDQLYEVTGDVSEAGAQALVEDVARATSAGRLQPALVSSMYLAQLERLQGCLRAAVATLEEAIRTIPEPLQLEDFADGQGYAYGLGEVRLEWNELDEAERLLIRGKRMQTQRAAPARTVAKGYIALARLQQARGDASGALATLDAFAALARERDFLPVWLERVAAARARLQLAQGNLAEAIHWAQSCGLSAADAELPFLRERAYLTFVRIHIAQGRDTAGGLFLQEALRLLQRLLIDAQAKYRGDSALEILILRALAQHAGRDSRGAVGTLARALTLAQPEGYVRLFADEGEPMARALTELIEAAHQGRLAVPADVLGYAQALVAACRSRDGGVPAPSPSMPPAPQTPTGSGATQSPLPPGVPPLLDPLTVREVEVLHLLAEGASNGAIAAALVVTEGTVKKHVYHICSKLGARNRTQAIARARALHLL
jgi:LuxR family maltose regulon positive regulatory protein